MGELKNLGKDCEIGKDYNKELLRAYESKQDACLVGCWKVKIILFLWARVIVARVVVAVAKELARDLIYIGMNQTVYWACKKIRPSNINQLA